MEEAQVPTTPYGYAVNGTRFTVHVVTPEGWEMYVAPGNPSSLWEEGRQERTHTNAWAMCGAGLGEPADWPDEQAGQKWCPRCMSPELRAVLSPRRFPRA